MTPFDLNEEAGNKAANEIGGVFVKVNVADEASVTAGLDVGERARMASPVSSLIARASSQIMKTVGKEFAPHALGPPHRRTIEVNPIGTFNAIATRRPQRRPPTRSTASAA